MPVNVQPSTKTYVPKKACKKCGGHLRYTNSRNCVECNRDRAKKYWAKHPDAALVYAARRAEKKRLTRARRKHLEAMGRPFTPTRKPGITGKMKVQEAMDTTQATAALGIVGTMRVRETRDAVTIKGFNTDLRQGVLAQILLRDSIIWKHRHYSMSAMSEDDGEVLGSVQADKIENYRPLKPTQYIKTDKACPRCGTFMKYEKSGSCVECLKRRNRAIKVAKRKAREAAKVVELRPGLGLRATQIKSTPTLVEPSAKIDFMRAAEKVSARSVRQPRWSDH
jgi:hypothetical protein